MDSYGIPMDSYGIPMDSYGFLWNSYGFLWIPMDSYGFLWNSYGFLWIPVDSNGIPMDSDKLANLTKQKHTRQTKHKPQTPTQTKLPNLKLPQTISPDLTVLTEAMSFPYIGLCTLDQANVS